MSKRPDITEFDQFIQQSLEGAKVPAPSGVFEGISAATSTATTASNLTLLSKIGGIKGLIVAATVVVVSTIAIVTLNSDEEPKPQKDQNAPGLVENEGGQTTDQLVDNKKQENKAQTSNQNSQVDNSSNSNSSPGEKNTSVNGDHNPISEATNNPVQSSDSKTEEKKEGDDKEKHHSNQEALKFSTQLNTNQICINDKFTVKLQDNNSDVDFYWSVNGVKHYNKSELEIEANEAGVLRVNLISFPNGKKSSYGKEIMVHSAKAKVTSQKVQTGLYQFKTEENYKTYKWQFCNSDALSQAAQPRQYFDYKNLATCKVVLWTVSKEGCKDSVHSKINLVEAPIITNTFTPYNKDGINDEFLIPIEHEVLYELIVYNSRGERVFESSDKSYVWNGEDMNSGEMLPAGIYTYQFVYQQKGLNKKVVRGTINLLK